jgi:hypothetical protein
MWNEQDTESASVWRAAQYRRTDDLATWLSPLLKQSGKKPKADIGGFGLRLALVRGMTIAVIAFTAIVSVSAVVQAERPSHVTLRPTGPMPDVNVP